MSGGLARWWDSLSQKRTPRRGGINWGKPRNGVLPASRSREFIYSGSVRGRGAGDDCRKFDGLFNSGVLALAGFSNDPHRSLAEVFRLGLFLLRLLLFALPCVLVSHAHSLPQLCRSRQPLPISDSAPMLAAECTGVHLPEPPPRHPSLADGLRNCEPFSLNFRTRRGVRVPYWRPVASARSLVTRHD